MQQPHFDVMAELQDLCWDSPIPEELGTTPVVAPKPFDTAFSATLNSLLDERSLPPLKQKQQRRRPKINRIREGGDQRLADDTCFTRGKSGFGGLRQYQQGFRCVYVPAIPAFD
jgi:hypothetical protein